MQRNLQASRVLERIVPFVCLQVYSVHMYEAGAHISRHTSKLWMKIDSETLLHVRKGLSLFLSLIHIFQGALSIGLSMSRLAAAVAKEGGVGVIAASEIGFMEKDFEEDPLAANKRALASEIKKALELAGPKEDRGPVGVNIMWSSRNVKEYVETAVEAGAEVLICGGGIPTNLPAYCRDKKVALVDVYKRQGPYH